MVFAAFVPGEGQEIARGGRYDHIGEVFGRARPATGVSADLKTLLRVGRFTEPPLPGKALAPSAGDAALEQRIGALRAAGWIVVRELPGQTGGAAELGCTHRLQSANGDWELIPL